MYNEKFIFNIILNFYFNNRLYYKILYFTLINKFFNRYIEILFINRNKNLENIINFRLINDFIKKTFNVFKIIIVIILYKR